MELKNLPPEILEEILGKLCFEDRRQARLVCSQWNEILSFRRFTEAEVLVYSNKNQRFQRETTREFPNVRASSSLRKDECLEFFRKAGKSTEFVEVARFSFPSAQKLNSFVRCFPRIKELRLTNQDLFEPIWTATEWLGNLQHVRFGQVDQWQEESFIESLQKVPKVTADVVSVKKPRNSTKLLKVLKLFELAPDVEARLTSNELVGLHLGDFNLVGGQKVRFEDVVNFENVPEKSVDLSLFPNLRILNLESPDGTCFFQHKVAQMKAVRTIIWEDGACLDCLKCVAGSCPNAVFWRFPTLNQRFFEEIADVFTKIESITCWDDFDLHDIFEKASEIESRSEKKFFRNLVSLDITWIEKNQGSNWPSMPVLKRLALLGTLKPSSEAIERITSATPSVRVFSSTLTLRSGDLEMIASRWPYLTCLHVGRLEGPISEEFLLNFCRTCRNLNELIVKPPLEPERLKPLETQIMETFSRMRKIRLS